MGLEALYCGGVYTGVLNPATNYFSYDKTVIPDGLLFCNTDFVNHDIISIRP